MAANALVSVRINEDVKNQAGAVLAGAGLTISDVIRMTLTKIATEQRFSFDYQPNAETARVLASMQNGTETLHRADSVEALMEQLNESD
ncbi:MULTISPECIES: type II toxin-antitoxin system RelB/DinJ family antitoxin [unclassified Neisseria]|uniref:type II toxin-antitoxin system RelB/DinJ family antitoxin n=1 Tax=unclassified Neisseria TaxID=2623750 RepID=UPI002666324E|nr:MULTISPECIES: type II toxin-antitoxin system RelB/DinJ family antitoxin [unclassified Neisseria]MDO1510341.1 type II toxin-antitoxin system RelB/DinJ family antitoxin [Neisseria sp. MVDL19-042950]MDO1516510.1 type II toxin-antitoxin system RelB/DinJ family antitoxin [Neisseria sp. MVDL18-041461]MDO1563697.1 type II toxin-antitoxin system RelB/DinJ family antitoxin [Neisseria sp. MVDL20-010259]